MKYEAVIFDLDGTLLNTLGDLAASANHALTKYGLPERTVDEVREFVGNGIRLLVERSVPEGTDVSVIDAVFNEYCTYYATHARVYTKPYDGIMDMLRALREKGLRVAVVSNKIDPSVKELAEYYFGELCEIAVGERPGIGRKPCPDSVLEVMKEFGTKKAVYVGDSEVDVETAKNAGIDGVFVSWGFRGRSGLYESGAEIIVDTAEELLREVTK